MKTVTSLFDKPHRRYNLLTGEYVLVSPQRAARPWQGKTEQLPDAGRPQYDSKCYLCPGNSRAGGLTNPDYTDVFVFPNDFPALLSEPAGASPLNGPLLQAAPARGANRVLCFTPRHDLTLATMEVQAIEKVVAGWIELNEQLGAEPTLIPRCSARPPSGSSWSDMRCWLNRSAI